MYIHIYVWIFLILLECNFQNPSPSNRIRYHDSFVSYGRLYTIRQEYFITHGFRKINHSKLWYHVFLGQPRNNHYSGVIMSAIASQMIGLSMICSTVGSAAENIKAPRHWPMWGEFTNSPHKVQVTRKMFPFDESIMMMQLVLLHTM